MIILVFDLQTTAQMISGFHRFFYRRVSLLRQYAHPGRAIQLRSHHLITSSFVALLAMRGIIWDTTLTEY